MKKNIWAVLPSQPSQPSQSVFIVFFIVFFIFSYWNGKRNIDIVVLYYYSGSKKEWDGRFWVGREILTPSPKNPLAQKTRRFAAENLYKKHIRLN